MAVYVKVADAVDLLPGHAIAVTVGDKRLALFSVDGTVVAIDDTCTHRGGPLSEGELKDGIVTCPWHGWRFNVKTGKNPESDVVGVRTFEVKVEGEDILLGV